MRNKFIRISFFLTCAAYACSDSNAMENENPNIESSRIVEEKTSDSCSTTTKEQWTILEEERTGEYARFGALYGGRYSKELRMFPFEKSKSNSFFLMIFMGKVASLEITGLHSKGEGEVVDVNDMYYLHILPKPWDFSTREKKEFVIGLVKEFESKGIKYIQDGDFRDGNGCYSCYHKGLYPGDKVGELLSVFYNKKLIPEYVMDRIINFGIKEFRGELAA